MLSAWTACGIRRKWRIFFGGTYLAFQLTGCFTRSIPLTGLHLAIGGSGHAIARTRIVQQLEVIARDAMRVSSSRNGFG